MATTTTNFGWDIPQSTDLVKDGATAIAALGQDIDTAFIDLKGGTTGQVLAKASGTDLDFSWVAQDDSNAIQNAIVDAKGDLIAATAADTPARLAVGTNGHVLTADSAEATGLKWAAASGGGMTLLSTTTLSGTSTTITIAPTGYNNLQIIAKGIYCNSTANIAMRLNSDTGANYNSMEFSGNATSSISGSAYKASTYLYQQDYRVETSLNNLYNGGLVLNLYRVNDTDAIDHNLTFNGGISGGTPQYWYGNSIGRYNNSAAITGITFTTMAGTPSFSGGTVYVYGVK